MTQAVLALDQGSHASRACLFDAAGELRATAQVAIATQHPAEGLVEHQPLEIVASLRDAAAQCLGGAPDLQVECVGLATQRSSIVCLERHSLLPLSAVISWQDRRNAEWLVQLAPQAERIRSLTGLPLSPHYGASKLRWCLDHLSVVQQAQRQGRLCLAPLASFLQAALGGARPLADPANASRTLLWDSSTLDWSDELLQLFGIERLALPECTTTHGDFGKLQIGDQQLPLSAMTGDQSAVPFAFGAPDERTAYLNLGTGAFIQRPLQRRPDMTAPLLGSVLAVTAEHALYSLEGTVNGAGSAVSWFAAGTQQQESALWTALEQLPDATPLPLFVNGIGGLGSPWWRATMPSRFVGDGSELERFAAVIDSVVCMIAANFKLMAARTGPLARLLITGGMSRSDWLCRRLAASLGVTVERMDAEATARGVAALAAPELARRWPPLTGLRFEPRVIAGLNARRDAFGQLIDATP
jgi:glycerol kinase